jgi:hypothetical protein
MAAPVRPMQPSAAPPSTVRAHEHSFVTDPIVLLSGLIALLALVATLVGLFWQDGGDQFSFRTVHGEAVRMFGQGIYGYDTLFQGAINRGTDAVTLILGIPLLAGTVLLYRRGSLKGALLLSSVLAFFLYVYTNMAFGAAYNNLYLVYVGLFAASLFAFVRLAAAISREALAFHLLPGAPRRALALFMFASGAVTLVVWLSDVLGALVQGQPPAHLDSYTTMVTYALDLGIITPACFLTGTLLLKRNPLGYLLTFPLFGILVLLVPTIVAQTISQAAAGVSLTPGEVIGPVAGFAVLGVVAIWLLYTLLRNISEEALPSVTRLGDQR